MYSVHIRFELDEKYLNNMFWSRKQNLPKQSEQLLRFKKICRSVSAISTSSKITSLNISISSNSHFIALVIIFTNSLKTQT